MTVRKTKNQASQRKANGAAEDHSEKPNEAAFRALVRTYGLVRRAAEPYFAQFGISGSQWGVLRVLHRGEQEGLAHLRLTDLGDRLLIRPPSVTTVVDRLHRLGLVTRDVSSQDLRAKQISLTDPGRRLVLKILQNHPRHIKMILGGLTGQQQDELRRLLDRLSEQLESSLDGHAEEPAAVI
jgi:DNA-binding MarR family transcriptional regulator